MIGDSVEKVLSSLGINHEGIEHWLGRPCGCEERKQKLNSLDLWARRILSGKVDRAREFLTCLLKS